MRTCLTVKQARTTLRRTTAALGRIVWVGKNILVSLWVHRGYGRLLSAEFGFQLYRRNSNGDAVEMNSQPEVHE